jgi:hypothetical protein
MAAAKKKVVAKVAKVRERPSVEQYFAALEPERRAALQTVRKLIARRMPKGYEQTLQYGMPTWVVPLATYPAGYLGKKDVPLPYVSLAAQKQHMAVYLMGVYGDPRLLKSFTAAWKKSGKKLDMGKSCLRFKSVEDLALDALGDAIASVPVLEYVERYERARGPR